MSSDDLQTLQHTTGVAPWRLRLAERIESVPVQRLIIGAILVNAVVLGLAALRKQIRSRSPNAPTNT